MKSRAAVLLALALFSSALAPQVEAAVLRVVVLQTSDPAAYVKEMEKGRAIIKRLGGSATIRVWRARFAGADAGAVVVSAEYPDLATYASDEAKVAADAEFQAWLKGLDKVRKIVSDSLYDELK